MTSNCAGAPRTFSYFFVPAVISLLDGVTSLTGWMNFAHHNAAHGCASLAMAGAFTAIGFAVRRTRCPQ